MSASKNLLDVKNRELHDATCYVQQVARWFRRRGLKSGHAIERAAETLGITPDLAWRLHYQHRIFALSSARLRVIELRYLSALRTEVAHLEAETARLRLMEAQLTQTLGAETACASSSSASSLPTPFIGCAPA